MSQKAPFYTTNFFLLSRYILSKSNYLIFFRVIIIISINFSIRKASYFIFNKIGYHNCFNVFQVTDFYCIFLSICRNNVFLFPRLFSLFLFVFFIHILFVFFHTLLFFDCIFFGHILTSISTIISFFYFLFFFGFFILLWTISFIVHEPFFVNSLCFLLLAFFSTAYIFLGTFLCFSKVHFLICHSILHIIFHSYKYFFT